LIRIAVAGRQGENFAELGVMGALGSGGDVMPASFTIREMTEPDRDGVIVLRQELQDIEAKLHAGRRSWDREDTCAYCDAVTVRMRTGGGNAFVAEAEGRIVGLLMGWVENDRVDLQVHEKEKRCGFIGETIVAGEHRRRAYTLPWRTPWSAIRCARALWEATSTCRLPPKGEATGATKPSWKKN
jgi:hypothetical protein